MATQYAVLLVIEDGGHERALKDSVSAVEGEQALGIERLGAFVPLAIDPLAIGQEVAPQSLVLRSTHFSRPFGLRGYSLGAGRLLMVQR
jgi:hypothetical protein